MASLWTRLYDALRGKAHPNRNQIASRRRLRIETLENRQLLASDFGVISGVVFTDLTDNSLTGDDTRLSSATVELFLDGGDLTADFGVGAGDDTLVGTDTTGVSGDYEFDQLLAGTYFVRQTAVTGLLQRTSVTVQTVTISAGDATGAVVQSIDSFDSTTQVATAQVGGPTPVSDATLASEAIGGERDFYTDATAGTAAEEIRLSADAGGTTDLLTFTTGTNVTGTRIVTYDGIDSDGATIDPTGLGGIDLTSGGTAIGFRFLIGTDTSGTDITIRVFSNSSDASFVTVPIPVTISGLPTDTLIVRFSDLATLLGSGADFTDVGAIQLEFPANASTGDGSLDEFETIGETVFTNNFANLNPMSIGNLVFRDNNNDGDLDSGETGIQGVTIQLFEDTDSDGSYTDTVDQLVTTTGTGGSLVTDTNGNFLFEDLFPGSYIVVVANSQFASGQALEGHITSSGNDPAPDPDDNVNSEDNGTLVALTGVVSAAMTLTAAGEPTSDGDADANTNLTLDLGFAPQIELSVDKSTTSTDAPAGTDLTYTLTATNDGPEDATGVRVVDTLAANVQFVSATGGTGTPVFTAAVGLTPATVEYTIGNLAAGATSTSLTLVVRVLASATGTVVNDAEVFGTELETGLVINTDSVTLPVTRTATLTIDKSDTPDPVSAGNNLTYTILVRNTGPSTATNVVVTDPLPSGVNFVSATATVGGVAIAAPTFGSGTVTANIGTMGVDDPGLDTDAIITIIVAVPADFTGSSLDNTATVDSDESAPLDSDESTNVDRTVDLTIDKSTTATSAVPGQNVTYTISVTNDGPNTATQVEVTDTLPTGLTFSSIVLPSGATGGQVGSSQAILVTIPTLASGASEVITLVVGVNQSAPSSLINTANVGLQTGQTGITESGPLPNSDSVTLPVDRQLDLLVTKSQSTASVIAGEQITYTVTLNNAGPSDATSLVLTDNIPDGIQIVSATSGSGTVTVPSSASDTTAANPDDLTLNLSALALNGTSTITIVANVLPGTRGTITNSAAVTIPTGTGQTDVGSRADSASIDATVTAQVDLVITKSDSPDPVIAGQTVTYTIDVTNDGPSTANSVVITDDIPDGIQIVSATSTSGTVAVPSSASDTTATNPDNLSLNLTQLAPNTSSTSTPSTGSTARITIVANVLPTTRGTLANTALVVATEDSTGETAAANTTVNTQLDLSITKDDATTSPVAPGAALVYTITVTNSGPSTATNVNVSDTLPSQLTFVSGSVSGGTVTNNSGVLSVAIPSIAPNSSAVITINTTVNAGAQATVTNTATVTTTETETSSSNNTSSHSTILADVGSISGQVYIDANNNDVFDTGEEGIEGVTIQLTGTNFLSQAVNQTVQTDADGEYSFDNLLPGTYSVVQTQPTGFDDASETAGTNGSTIAGNDQFTVVLAAGADSTANNLGETPIDISKRRFLASRNPGLQ